MKMLGRRLFAAALLCAASGQALAQASVGGRTVYEVAFFQQYAPSNALQIIERVPGFQLDEGDTEVRGFGQAAGNVVINGQRPATKSDTLDTVLSRIPANRVLRVEVGPGETFGSEYAGKAQVVNLILSESGGVAGTAMAHARRGYDGTIYPEGSLSGLVRSGASTFNAAIEFDSDAVTEEGSDRITRLPSGELIEFRRKINETEEPNLNVSASWAYDGGTNKTAHLNGRYFIDWFRLSQANSVFPATGPARDDSLDQKYDYEEYEIGGDITRPLAGGGLKLVGVATRRNRERLDESVNRVGAATIGGSDQLLVDRREETVARLVWNRTGWAGWTVEAGAEGALNILDSDVGFFTIDGTGTRTRVDLPVDQAKVKEKRAEGFINGGRALSSTLRLDMDLTYEASRLTVSGDATAERELQFWKPKTTLDWRPGDGWRLQLSAQRTVAQLQFEDFISVAELSNDRVNGGNANLVPQRAWEFLLTAEKTVLGDGLIKLEAGRTFVSLVQDRVPTPEGFDAPGNLGDGTELIARATVDVPLSAMGIKGGRLKTYWSMVDTSVRDPYTLRNRSFSGNNTLYTETSFRQDLGKFAWGVLHEYGTVNTNFRRNELDRNLGSHYVEIFAEYRPSATTTITVGIENLLDSKYVRERTFFTPDRRSPNPTSFEYRERKRHILPFITIKRNFG
ncbi:hypothetical protein ACFOMD_06030 [Sphingoaurantiacus capsulatus]|uniref:TonB-dependent receptor n=1 Tax=Sphingoaurantiacus capsulatus TaxID=1771310 RepID=A0ABV7XA51_9SPHN